MQNEHLPTYLHRIEWDKEQFTPDRLEIMLAASCLRFLGGLEDISFVFGLSEAIRKNHLETMTLPLRHATAILHDLAEELGNNTILSTDNDTIRRNIDHAQEVVTKRNFDHF
jgi:hypothetical protein